MDSAEVESWRANRMTRRSLFRAVALWPAQGDRRESISRLDRIFWPRIPVRHEKGILHRAPVVLAKLPHLMLDLFEGHPYAVIVTEHVRQEQVIDEFLNRGVAAPAA